MRRSAILRNFPTCYRLNKRFLSVTCPLSTKSFRSNKDDPFELSVRNDGQFYSVSKEAAEHLNFKRNLPKYYRRQFNTFGVCDWMIRKPALDAINCLKHLPDGSPTPRFVLYGHFGTGKTMTLLQILHSIYCSQKWIIVYIKSMMDFTRTEKELAQSKRYPQLIDTPADCAHWLAEFKLNNTLMIDTLNTLTTSQDEVWNERETTPAGTPLTELVEFGIDRAVHSADVIEVLLKELKSASNENKIKLFVGIDDVNSMFHMSRIKRKEDFGVWHYAPSSEVAMVQYTKNVLKHDWINGVVFLALDEKEFSNVPKTKMFSLQKKNPDYHLPCYLLGYYGFELLDPFVPIETNNYNQSEIDNCFGYYMDKNWIQHEDAKTEEGKQLISNVTGSNPFNIERFLASI